MKKYIYQWVVLVLFFLLLFTSCDDYLDVDPKGVQILETTQDYDLWLNSDEIQQYVPNELYWLGDNIDNLNISTPFTSTDDRVYTWQEQFSEKTEATPVIWAPHYKSIYYFNTVIQEIDGAAGSEQEKKRLKAEALLGRAFEYLYLVNLYGKVYDVNTADVDLAVPFVTSNDLNTPVPDRSTVQDIYDHIITDLTTAISDLPANNNDNRFRGSVAAAYSVLARTYLYMGDYAKAAQNAQLAMDSGPNKILDYSAMVNEGDITYLVRSSDAIYARLCKNLYNVVYPSLTFLQSFDTADLRLNFFYRNPYYMKLDNYNFTTRGYVIYPIAPIFNWGTSVAEMRLIIAEASARANDLSTACIELDSLRKKRFPKFIIDNTVTPPDTTFRYEKFESTNQEEVLQKVLAERTFEFPYNGLRWFDMRRLDTEGRMQEVNRYNAENDVIVTLSPGSAKYTLQIPIQVLYFTPDWPRNPQD